MRAGVAGMEVDATGSAERRDDFALLVLPPKKAFSRRAALARLSAGGET